MAHKSLIPKLAEAQEKYAHRNVIPKLQDVRSQNRLNIMVGVIFSLVTGVLCVLLLHYVFGIFTGGWPNFFIGISLLIILLVVSWIMGVRIARIAGSMRINHYYYLYDNYLENLNQVQKAREALINAEKSLSKTEYNLDKLIANTYNRPLFVSGLAAIFAVIVHRFKDSRSEHSEIVLESDSSNEQNIDLTDHVVRYHEDMMQKVDKQD